MESSKFGPLSEAQDGGGLSARSQAGGRVWGLVVGAEMRGQGLGARSQGSLWEGPGPGQVRSGQVRGPLWGGFPGQMRGGGAA